MKNPGPQIIVGFKEGNANAFHAVYKMHYRALYNFVKQLTDDTLEAEDIVAETFVKLWNIKDRFETDNNIKAFLYITARNASLNYLRYRKNQVANKKEFVYLHSETFEPNEVPVKLQLLELIQHTLEELPVRQQQIMRMILFEGLNDKEVAERLNKNPKTVRNLKAEAVNRLRVTLDRNELAYTLLIIYFFPN
jgi:RNA polymerase sigma-70 factor (ECF subfamily)